MSYPTQLMTANHCSCLQATDSTIHCIPQALEGDKQRRACYCQHSYLRIVCQHHEMKRLEVLGLGKKADGSHVWGLAYANNSFVYPLHSIAAMAVALERKAKHSTSAPVEAFHSSGGG